MHVAAEGRVEYHKLNQAGAQVFDVQLDYSSRKKSDPARAYPVQVQLFLYLYNIRVRKRLRHFQNLPLVETFLKP